MSDDFWLAIFFVNFLAFAALWSLTNDVYVAFGAPLAIDALLPILRIRQRREWQARRLPVVTSVFWETVELSLVGKGDLG